MRHVPGTTWGIMERLVVILRDIIFCCPVSAVESNAAGDQTALPCHFLLSVCFGWEQGWCSLYSQGSEYGFLEGISFPREMDNSGHSALEVWSVITGSMGWGIKWFNWHHHTEFGFSQMCSLQLERNEDLTSYNDLLVCFFLSFYFCPHAILSFYSKTLLPVSLFFL